jgi:hypothetical protein
MVKKKQATELIKSTLKKYDLDLETACWDCHGQWVILHKACQIIAIKAGIEWHQPEIIHSDPEKKTVVLLVRGSMPADDTVREEWSFGEAAPYNNKNSYPYAMAEKRGKDRVILSLAGLHGYVYSDIEADDFNEPPPEPPPEPVSEEETAASPKKRDYVKELNTQLQRAGCTNPEDAGMVCTWIWEGVGITIDEARSNYETARTTVRMLQDKLNNGTPLDKVLDRARKFHQKRG